MNSPANSAPSKDYPRWAREVRKDKLPTCMREHLGEVEEFFDHYASSVEEWRRRNEGYHRTISSIGSTPRAKSESFRTHERHE